MGLDVSAHVVWGLRTTRKAVFRKEREWIGKEDGDRSFDFDPKTGKSNWKVSREPIKGLEYDVVNISDGWTHEDEDVFLVILHETSTGSHRENKSVKGVIPLHGKEPLSQEEEKFKETIKSLGIPGTYGMWLYLCIS